MRGVIFKSETLRGLQEGEERTLQAAEMVRSAYERSAGYVRRLLSN